MKKISYAVAIVLCALVTACGGGEASEAAAAPVATTESSPLDLAGRPAWDKGEESCDECVRGAGVMQPGQSPGA